MDIKKATVQYGDFHGEIAIDGHEGPFIHELAKIAGVPATHFPIGFSIYGGEGVSINSDLHLSVFAVNKDDYGNSVEKIVSASLNDTIQAEQYQSTIELEELFKHIKRIEFRPFLKALNEVDVQGREE